MLLKKIILFLKKALLKFRGLYTPPWFFNFPHLGDLYLDSDQNQPNNYFRNKNVSAGLSRQPPDSFFIDLENDLNLMDYKDWQEFKSKTIPYVTVKDKWGWHLQLFERFNEAKAYAFLKNQGYTHVHFIEEDQSQKTPDLYGKGSLGVVVLEAKRIRDSDQENDYLVMPIEKKRYEKDIPLLARSIKK